jgi:hypothetical protein
MGQVICIYPYIPLVTVPLVKLKDKLSNDHKIITSKMNAQA